jgi:acyl-CoA thioesterase YciA
MKKEKPTMRDPALRVTLLPRDTNAAGTIFGGVILSLIDLAGGVEARKQGSKRFVTVAMREVVFKRPVYVGDIVSLYTKTVKIGNTSVTVKVEVEVQRGTDPSRHELVTHAEIVYVAVDETWKPIPVRDSSRVAAD